MKVKDYFLTQETFELSKNSTFGFLETKPQPKNLDQYYQSENYISHTDSAKTWMDKIYQFVKNYNIQYKLGIVPNSIKSLLDYGCGTGDFLVQAKKKDFQCRGVEPNTDAREIAQKKLGKENVTDQSIFEIDGKFDCISMWHVLEHIPNLENFIPALIQKLNANGSLIIAVPNYESFDAKFYEQHWAAYDVPRHLWHFSPKSMEKMFSHFGMKIEKTYPLWFDSYYVSILSEKYQNTPKAFGLIRATTIGTLSNLRGILTGNYSSVIYRIRKN